jgi:hypothetical protein
MNPDRRSFFKGAGILGAFTAGLVTPHIVVNAQEKPKEVVEDISHLAPESPTTFMLAADNRTAEERAANNPYKDSPYMITGFDHKETNRVSMSVGKDNRLWIQVDGKWRRVALDPSWCDPTYCDPAPDV